jgi:hypothetical protein
LVFVYYIRFDHRDQGCIRVAHAPGRRTFVGLEAIASRDTPEPVA